MFDSFFALLPECMPAKAADAFLMPSAQPKRGKASTDGMAVLEISGTLVMRQSIFDFGATISLPAITAELNALRTDETVNRVLVVLDSPGGTVAGTNAAAGALTKLAATKPTIVYVPSVLASGALWLASGATRIIADPTAIIGSIGVFRVLQDFSKVLSRAGIETTLITSGEKSLKGQGTPGIPLSEEFKQSVQDLVDTYALQFIVAVSKGRGIKSSLVSAMSDGSVFIGSIAKNAGLVDGVGSLEDAIAELMAMKAPETFANRMATHDRNLMATAGYNVETAQEQYQQLVAAHGDHFPKFAAHLRTLNKPERFRVPHKTGY